MVCVTEDHTEVLYDPNMWQNKMQTSEILNFFVKSDEAHQSDEVNQSTQSGSSFIFDGKLKSISAGNIKCLFTNARSIVAGFKLGELSLYAAQKEISVIAVTES